MTKLPDCLLVEREKLTSRLVALHELLTDMEKHDFNTTGQVKAFIRGSVTGIGIILNNYKELEDE